MTNPLIKNKKHMTNPLIKNNQKTYNKYIIMKNQKNNQNHKKRKIKNKN